MYELSHHGIKGQRWGVKHGPPYPLDQKTSSSISSKKTSSASKKTSSASSKKPSSTSKQTSSGSKETQARSLVNKMKSVTTSKALAGAEVDPMVTLAIATVASFGVMALLRKGFIKMMNSAMIEQDKRDFEETCKNRTIRDFDELPKLSTKMSPSESMKYINPGYPKDRGSTMNCTHCTLSMALREKGYDVKATPNEMGHDSANFFAKTFNGTPVKVPKNTTPKTLLNELSKNGEGSYGNITIPWKMGGSHSVFWKVENGQARIYDAQSATEYTKSSKMLNDTMSYAKMDKIEYTRLDNCKPTEYALAVVEPNKKK